MSIEGSEFEIDADMVIPAVAQEPDLSIFPKDFFSNIKGYRTGVEGVFAGGDFLVGTTNVIEVIAQAHEVSLEILRFFGQEPKLSDTPKSLRRIEQSPWYSDDPEKLHREKVYGGWLISFKDGFRVVEEGMRSELAAYEASRCLQCDFFVDINKDTCHRCGRCVESCPQEALELAYQEAIPGKPGTWFSNGKWYTDEASEVLKNPELCTQCGTCLRACPHQNISFVSSV